MSCIATDNIASVVAVARRSTFQSARAPYVQLKDAVIAIPRVFRSGPLGTCSLYTGIGVVERFRCIRKVLKIQIARPTPALTSHRSNCHYNLIRQEIYTDISPFATIPRIQRQDLGKVHLEDSRVIVEQQYFLTRQKYDCTSQTASALLESLCAVPRAARSSRQ